MNLTDGLLALLGLMIAAAYFDHALLVGWFAFCMVASYFGAYYNDWRHNK